jgi:hypothetical protein
MELYREIRAFYIKLPYPYRTISQDMVNGLWNLSRELAICAIDINKKNEVLMHSEIEFSLENWNNTIRYLRSAINLLNSKSGYMVIRKVSAARNALKTEIESYKVTKRGVYNAELPESSDFLEDIIRFSGRNKKIQQIEAMEKLFKYIEEQEKNEDKKGDGD